MSAASRQEHAFTTYVELGPNRNLRLLEETLRANRGGARRAPSLRTLEGWSAHYGWQERLIEIERRAREEQEQQHVGWVQQHRERLRQEGLLLQQKGIEWLTGKLDKDVSAGEAIRAVDAGFKLEALALGEATTRIAIDEEDERLKGLNDDELKLLIRQVRAHRAASGPAAGEETPG